MFQALASQSKGRGLQSFHTRAFVARRPFEAQAGELTFKLFPLIPHMHLATTHAIVILQCYFSGIARGMHAQALITDTYRATVPLHPLRSTLFAQELVKLQISVDVVETRSVLLWRKLAQRAKISAMRAVEPLLGKMPHQRARVPVPPLSGNARWRSWLRLGASCTLRRLLLSLRSLLTQRPPNHVLLRLLRLTQQPSQLLLWDGSRHAPIFQ